MGLARVNISLRSGNEAYFGIGTQDVGFGADRLETNNAEIAIMCMRNDTYRFWVPECATGLRLRVAEQSNPPATYDFTLYDADGNAALQGSTGYAYSLNLSTRRRNAAWRLVIEGDGDGTTGVHGVLTVGFEQDGQSPDW